MAVPASRFRKALRRIDCVAEDGSCYLPGDGRKRLMPGAIGIEKKIATLEPCDPASIPQTQFI
jgi:hypothetical protein